MISSIVPPVFTRSTARVRPRAPARVPTAVRAAYRRAMRRPLLVAAAIALVGGGSFGLAVGRLQPADPALAFATPSTSPSPGASFAIPSVAPSTSPAASQPPVDDVPAATRLTPDLQ